MSALSGSIREFDAWGFCVEDVSEAISEEDVINEYYRSQWEFKLQIVETLSNGPADLERVVQDLLIRGNGAEGTDLSHRRRYLAFRLMDLVDDHFDGGLSKTKITRLESTDVEQSRRDIFFLLRLNRQVLVLQFGQNLLE